jgi:hypothetical protein
MWMKLICLVIIFMAIPGIKGEIPLAYTPAAISGGQNDVLTVKNYDTGAVMTESYTDVEHLNRDTQVRTGAYANSADAASPRGGLEASISSNVIGNAHIAWQSVDPGVTVKGRHPLIGRSVEDLTGVFSIEKLIQLWSDSQSGEICVDWLPCS